MKVQIYVGVSVEAYVNTEALLSGLSDLHGSTQDG